MTKVIRWSFVAVLAGVTALAGCGSDKDATAGARLIQTGIKSVVDARKAAKGQTAPVAAPTRADLAAFNQPIIQADLPATGLTTYFVPFGSNGGVETWSNADDQTVSFRQGVLTATRGFGPDIMQSVVPSAAQLASGSGSYGRVYYYLDGADQTQRFDFNCTLANSGSETITVVGQQHSTRHVTETCTGKQGDFVNEYWFENSNLIRKSKQLLVPAWGAFTFQRVIDKG